ncbi:MAG: hypothetical protein HQL09_09575 [Nitrospirae bacterium]|nr:hypothetical protein [Nitrospirota bacterium]
MGKCKCGNDAESQVAGQWICAECLLKDCVKCGSKEVFLLNEDSDYALCKVCWKQGIEDCIRRMEESLKQLEEDERFLRCDNSVSTDTMRYGLEIIKQEILALNSICKA